MLVRHDLGISPLMAADGTAPSGAATTAAPTEAQGATAAPAGDSAAQAVTEEPSYFFEYDWGDGKVDRFETEEKFREGYRNGVLRHDKFGSEMRRLAEERKKHESDRSRYDNEYNEFLRTRRQWEEQNASYAKMSPAERQALADYLKRNLGGNGQEVSEAMKRVEALEKKLSTSDRAKELEARRRKTYDTLKRDYPDFNEEAVQAKIDELNRSPDGLRDLSLLIHYALLGEKRPAEMQQSIVNGLKQKQDFAQPRGGKVTPPGQSTAVPASLEEAAELAKKAMRKK